MDEALALIEEGARLAGEASSVDSVCERRSSRYRISRDSCRCRLRRAPAVSEQDRTAPSASRRAGLTGSQASYPEHLRAEVERYLEALRFDAEPETAGLEEAMRYSLLAGGKRIRPVLALATAARSGASRRRAAAGRRRSS